MSNLWIILCVLCSYSQTESQTVRTVENKTDWFTANETCIMHHGRLPSVNIYDHRLQLKDLSETKNIPSPFWVAATYDIMNYNHCEAHYADVCPDTFCLTIAISSGEINVEWRPCWECNNFSCVDSYNGLYDEADWKWECKDWTGAFQYCKERNARLASRENVPFLKRVANFAKTFWLDDMPHNYLAHDIRLQNGTCLYSFNGTIHEGNCSDTLNTTVCILEQKTGTTHTTSTMVSSQTKYIPGITHTTSTVFPSPTVYTAGITHTTPTMVPSPTVYTTCITHTTPTMVPSQTEYTGGITQTEEYSITNKPVITLSTNRLKTSRSYVLDSSEKPAEKTSKEQTKGIWTIIGSALGGFVVIIVVVVIIVIVLRRRRMKNDPEIAFNSDANNKPATTNLSQTQNEYDTVLGESFVLEATIATSTRVSNTQEEQPEIYASPHKVKTNCRNPIDVPFNIKQPTDKNENTGLYSVVKKGMETQDTPNTFDNDDVHGNDYYDISFSEPSKGKAVENVYNKANFVHSGRDHDQTVNLYDKANFSHESLQNNSGNDYDESNFYHKILEK